MDRRKLQRVALLAGLLFLILLAIGTLLHAAGEAVKAEDQQKLGALVRDGVRGQLCPDHGRGCPE